MSSSTTTSITLPKHKSSKKPDNKSKQKHTLFERNTASPSSLLSKGGPPESEFFQFYSELYKSALLFSNPKFQQMLLFPHQSQAQSFINNNRCVSSPNTMMMMKNKRAMKKAQRRLSGGSAQQQSSNNNSNINYHTSSTSTMSMCDGDYNSADSGGSLTKKSFSDHFLAHRHSPIAPMTSTPTQTGKTKVTGGLKLKRRVSFSKNSPRARSRSNSQQQQYNKQGSSSTNNNVPWITIQEHCWSSDMDETDTTEDSDEEDATSSSVLLYVGTGGKKEGGGSGTCDRDGDNENSTTDDGKKNVKKATTSMEEVDMQLRKLSTTTKQKAKSDMPESEA